MPEHSDPPGHVGFKACYRHPRRPAIKNCQYCGKPICRDCELESGDHRLCAPCKKKLIGSTPREGGTPAPRADRETIDVGDLTVLDDGRVVGVKRPEPARAPESAGSDLDAGGSALSKLQDAAGCTAAGEHSQAASAPASAPEGSLRPAPPMTGAKRLSKVQAGGEPESPGAPEPTPAGRPGERASDGIPGDEPMPGSRAGLEQALRALPFALAVAAGLAGGWLLIGVLLEQWTQISVVTLGLAVPWVFYNMSTRARVGGKRTRVEAPVALVSIASFTIVALTAPLLEYLVYELGYADFMEFDLWVQTYFGTAGWALVTLGLGFALFSPVLLKLGGRWEVPKLRLGHRRRQYEVRRGPD